MSISTQLESVEVMSSTPPWVLECRFTNVQGESVPPPDGIAVDHIMLTEAPAGVAPLTVAMLSADSETLTVTLADGTAPRPPGVERPPYRIAVVGIKSISSEARAFVVEDPEIPSDCRKPTSPAKEVLPPAVPVSLLARDFGALRTLMLDQIAQSVPTWGETNPADLLVGLVEVLAYSGDLLSYHQDAVATEAYLTTGRRKLSVKRHARLMDYHVSPGVDARVWVAFEVTSAGWLDAGTPMTTQGPGLTSTVVSADAVSQARRLGHVLEFLTSYRLNVQPERNAISLTDPKGPPEQVIAAGATAVTVPENSSITVGDILIFEELVHPVTGLSMDADPQRRQAVRVVSAVATGDRIALTWSEADALRANFWVRTVTAGVVRNDISVVRGNVVLASHARPIEPSLDPPDVVSGVPYRPLLALTDLTWSGPLPQTNLPASVALVQDPAEAWPRIQLTDSMGRTWSARKDLLESGPFERHFVVDQGEDGGLQLRFGDGHLGALPSAGLSFTATALEGNGPVGNVGAGAIVHIVVEAGAAPGIERCWNPLPGAGGRDPEDLASVRTAAPHAYRQPLRAVTTFDWADLAEKLPEVRAASAEATVTGLQTAFAVSLDLYQNNSVQLARVESLLKPFRLVGNVVKFLPADYLAIEVVFVVWIEPGAAAATVRSELNARFGTGTFAGRPAFFAAGQHAFGDDVYLSQIIEGASATRGVSWIETDPTSDPRVRFQVVGAPVSTTATNVREGFIPIPDASIAVTTTGTAGNTGSVRFVIVEGS